MVTFGVLIWSQRGRAAVNASWVCGHCCRPPLRQPYIGVGGLDRGPTEIEQLLYT